MSISITGIDHLVLTVRDLEATCDFYANVLGAEIQTFGAGRTAIRCGAQKINVHLAGAEFEPHAATPAPGSGDFCLLTPDEIDDVVSHLGTRGVSIVEGPVEKVGARGAMTSVYVRDPDGNLVEIATYGDESESDPVRDVAPSSRNPKRSDQ